MTLYNDQAVKFGGVDVGGIRISHLSHIDKEIRVSLNTSRGKKGLYVIQPLPVEPARVEFLEAEHVQAIESAETIEELKARFETAWGASKGLTDARKRMKVAYDAALKSVVQGAA